MDPNAALAVMTNADADYDMNDRAYSAESLLDWFGRGGFPAEDEDGRKWGALEVAAYVEEHDLYFSDDDTDYPCPDGWDVVTA